MKSEDKFMKYGVVVIFYNPDEDALLKNKYIKICKIIDDKSTKRKELGLTENAFVVVSVCKLNKKKIMRS